MRTSKIVDDILIPLDLKEIEKPRFCFLVYSSKEKHIEIVIDCIESVIKEKESCDIKRLDDSLKSEDSQYLELRDLLSECSFGIVILDGLRPNVVFEYGILKGLRKPCIVLLEEEADVDVINYHMETKAIEIINPKIDMDKHFSDVKDRFYIKYNKNRPKEIREKVQREYLKLKKDIEAELIRMIFPNKDIIQEELRDQLVTLSELSKKRKEQLNPEDEIEFRVIIKNIDAIMKKYKIKLPKTYYLLISDILMNFEKYEEALEIIDPLIENKIEDLDLVYLKGFLLSAIKRYEESIETLNCGLKLKPKIESFWHAKGRIFERMEKKEEAELCYRKAIEFNLRCSSVNFHYGVLLYEKNQYIDALEQFEAAIKKEPTDDNYLMWKAIALHKLGNRGEGIKFAEEAICYNSNNANAWYVLGRLTSDQEESIKHFNKALSLAPKHGGAICSKGACLSNIGKVDEAMEIFDKMKEYCSEYYSCKILLLNISKTLSKKKRIKEALNYVDRVLISNENDTEALGVKAGIVFEDGKKEEALKLFKRSIELNPKDDSVWYNQACVYARLNKIDESIESLKKAIELAPLNKDSAQRDKDFNGIRENEKFIREFG
jgi:tetratricopeptide (TPR) repeat protein